MKALATVLEGRPGPDQRVEPMEKAGPGNLCRRGGVSSSAMVGRQHDRGSEEPGDRHTS